MPARPAGAMTGWLSVAVSFISDFVFGPAVVWLYAAMVPWFGPGSWTALRAALVIWVLRVAVPHLGLVRIGWLPGGVVAATSALTFSGFLPAAQLTARLYQE